jgi:hypothetical protein
MDDRKTDHLKPVPPSLQAAIRRARVESAEQSQAVADLREAEVARLELLLDMIGFVDMGHDRRTYRFFQDTRHGRVLIAESALAERIVAAMTNYIARRLVEREQALASDWRSKEAAASGAKPGARALRPAGAARAKDGARPPADAAATGVAPRDRGWLAAIGDLFSFLLLTLGSVAFLALVCLGAYVAWNAWGRALWTARFGAPPI